MSYKKLARILPVFLVLFFSFFFAVKASETDNWKKVEICENKFVEYRILKSVTIKTKKHIIGKDEYLIGNILLINLPTMGTTDFDFACGHLLKEEIKALGMEINRVDFITRSTFNCRYSYIVTTKKNGKKVFEPLNCIDNIGTAINALIIFGLCEYIDEKTKIRYGETSYDNFIYARREGDTFLFDEISKIYRFVNHIKKGSTTLHRSRNVDARDLLGARNFNHIEFRYEQERKIREEETEKARRLEEESRIRRLEEESRLRRLEEESRLKQLEEQIKLQKIIERRQLQGNLEEWYALTPELKKIVEQIDGISDYLSQLNMRSVTSSIHFLEKEKERVELIRRYGLERFYHYES